MSKPPQQEAIPDAPIVRRWPSVAGRWAVITALFPYALLAWAAAEGLRSKNADRLLFNLAPVPLLLSITLVVVGAAKGGSLAGRVALALDLVFLAVFGVAGFVLND